MDFVTVREISEKWNVTPRRVQMLCSGGQIPGAVKLGRDWLIPQDSVRPDDFRKKEFRMSRGFTLVEMLIVISVISSLVSIAIPATAASTEKAREAADAANIRSMYQQVMTESALTNQDVNVGGSRFGKTKLTQKEDAWQDTDIRESMNSLLGAGSALAEPAAGCEAWVEYIASEQKAYLRCSAVSKTEAAADAGTPAGTDPTQPAVALSVFSGDLVQSSKRDDGTLSLPKAILSGRQTVNCEMDTLYGIDNYVINTNIAKDSQLGSWLLSQEGLKTDSISYVKCITELDAPAKNLTKGTHYTATQYLYYGSEKNGVSSLYLGGERTVYAVAQNEKTVKYYSDAACTQEIKQLHKDINW